MNNLTKTYNLCRIPSIESFSKDRDNKHVDKEWYEERYSSFDEKI